LYVLTNLFTPADVLLLTGAWSVMWPPKWGVSKCATSTQCKVGNVKLIIQPKKAEHSGVVVVTLASFPVSITVWGRPVLKWEVCCFPQSLQENTGIAPYNLHDLAFTFLILPNWCVIMQFLIRRKTNLEQSVCPCGQQLAHGCFLGTFHDKGTLITSRNFLSTFSTVPDTLLICIKNVHSLIFHTSSAQ
jgi:hypothetical protein